MKGMHAQWTHIQRKGTIFVSEVSKNLTCEQCIFMNIFPFGLCSKRKGCITNTRFRGKYMGKIIVFSGIR